MTIYAITGGAGFIGSHLADALLQQGAHVRVLDDLSTGKKQNLDPRCELMLGDIRDISAVRRLMSGVDGCFHLAAVASVARSNEDWVGTHAINLGGTVNVLAVARDLGGPPVVYASSAAVYGRRSDVADETAPAEPLSGYGADKRGSELHARAGGVVHGLATLGFRFFNVYGPRQDPHSPYSGVISIFANQIAAGQDIHIHGNGQQTRDFIFVGDIVAFLRAGMATLQNGGAAFDPASGTVLNACTGRETSVLDLAHTLAEIFGTVATLRFGRERPGDIQRSVGSPELAKRLLGIEAKTRLSDGLAHTLAAIRGEIGCQAA